MPNPKASTIYMDTTYSYIRVIGTAKFKRGRWLVGRSAMVYCER